LILLASNFQDFGTRRIFPALRGENFCNFR
jgi:hypothetical protein